MRGLIDSGIPWIGKIPETWSKEKVIRIFQTIGSGTTPKSDDETYFEGNIKWIQSGDINGGLLTHSKSSVSSEALQRFSALKVYSAPYIVIAMYGASIGNMSVSMIDGCVNQACCVLGDTKQNLQYFFYVLKCSKDYLSWKSVGGGQPNISQETIKQLWLPLPSIEEQAEIVKTLDTECARIDAVMEQTRASIEEYKKLKQSVITQAVTKGIRPNRPMKDSGIDWIGQIPAEWGLPKMSAICEVITDYVASGSFASLAENVEYLDEPDYAMLVRTADVSEKGYSPKPVYISKHSYDFLRNSNLFGGELMLPNIGASVGDVYIVPKLYERMSLAPNSIMVKTRYVDKYYYYYFLGKPGRLSVEDIAQSTAQAKFNKTDFRQIRVPLPSESEQREIVAYLDKVMSIMDIIISKKQKCLVELESYKKSLIFEYVTGKKEVSY